MLHSLHFDTPCLTKTWGDAAATGSSEASRNANAGGSNTGGITAVNFSSGGDGTLGGFGVGPPLEFRLRRFGELSPLGDEDRLDGDGVPGDPGSDGAHTICSGVVERNLFSFSCSSVVTDSGVRLTLRSSGVAPSLDGSRGRFADFKTSESFPSEFIFGNALLRGWNVPFGRRKHGVSGSGKLAPGRVLALRIREYGTMRIGFVGNASAYCVWAGGVAPGDGGADPEVAEPPLAVAKTCLTTCLVLQ